MCQREDPAQLEAYCCRPEACRCCCVMHAHTIHICISATSQAADLMPARLTQGTHERQARVGQSAGGCGPEPSRRGKIHPPLRSWELVRPPEQALS
jgi:hypothetical protein